MGFHQFNKKITEHFDQCDIHDVDKQFYMDQEMMKRWMHGKHTLLGNPIKLYDTVYPVMWTFAVKNKTNGLYEHLLIKQAHITRDEIKQLYALCSEFGVQIDIWSKFIENSKKPKLNFRYSGGVMIQKIKENISDFTWKDDILLKTLLNTERPFTDIWSLMREAQAKEEARREQLREYKKNQNHAKKLHTPGDARRR